MNTEEIINGLSRYQIGKLPENELKAAIANREAIIPLLLEHLKEVAEFGDDLPKDRNVTLVFFACYLLAQFREKQALPVVVQLISASPKTVTRLLGYVISESLARIMASMMSDSSAEWALASMKPLIENEEIHPQVRYAALSTLTILAFHNQLPRDELQHYFQSLYEQTLEQTKNAVWDGLVFNTAVAGMVEFEPQVLKAHKDGLLVETMFDEQSLKSMLHGHPDEIRAPVYKSLAYIDDCVSELANWAAFRSTPPSEVKKEPAQTSSNTGDVQRVSRPWPARKPLAKNKRPIGQKQVLINPPMQSSKQPLIREGSKVGRNDPCPCGSGRKFKKCCG